MNKPAHDKTYNKTCVTSENSDQPAHPRSLIRVFADRKDALYSLQANQRWIDENPCHTEWMYRLIWVFAGHTRLIVGFVVRWLKS